MIAHNAEGFPTVDSLIEGLRDAVNETGAHTHGLIVLSNDWDITQEAYSDGRVFHSNVGDALMRARGMLNSMGSRRIGPAWMNRYLEPEPKAEQAPAPATPRPRRPRKTCGPRS